MGDFWVFGYGSLMWRPGFDFEEAIPARLVGVHRSLCIYSVVHRGTRRHPGLVLGLDSGGSCEGLAFRLAPSRIRETLHYLRAREQVTRVYRESFHPLHLQDGSKTALRGLCYRADQRHPQYAGYLPLAMQAHLVRRGRGCSGKNTDYIANTLRHLEEMGIHDTRLKRLMPLVGIRSAKVRR